MNQCPQCGAGISPAFRLCPQCGVRLTPNSTSGSLPPQQLPPVGTVTSNLHALPLAGFWLRVGAFFLDFLILVPLSLLVQASLLPFVGGIVAWWLYFSIFETSKWQATPGKRIIGLKVTDVNGVHIRFGRATARLFSKPLSGAILGIGFLLAAFTPHKQALHDLIAGTLVLKKN